MLWVSIGNKNLDFAKRSLEIHASFAYRSMNLKRRQLYEEKLQRGAHDNMTSELRRIALFTTFLM